MTEEPEPSREKLAAALRDLAGRIVQGSLERETLEYGRESLGRLWQKVNDIELTFEGFPRRFSGSMESNPKCAELKVILKKSERPVADLQKLIKEAQHVLNEWQREV